MKLTIILVFLMVLIVGCSNVQIKAVPTNATSNMISDNITVTDNITGTEQLMLNAQDLSELGMQSNGTDCQTEYDYSNIVDSALGQYSICYFNITALFNTRVIIEFNKFANLEELNGSYQYDSSHLYSVQGLISENDFGDQSRFRINNVNDYGGNLTNSSNTYYHLWICKKDFLIHITSIGSKNADAYIKNIGRLILSKFG